MTEQVKNYAAMAKDNPMLTVLLLIMLLGGGGTLGYNIAGGQGANNSQAMSNIQELSSDIQNIANTLKELPAISKDISLLQQRIVAVETQMTMLSKKLDDVCQDVRDEIYKRK